MDTPRKNLYTVYIYSIWCKADLFKEKLNLQRREREYKEQYSQQSTGTGISGQIFRLCIFIFFLIHQKAHQDKVDIQVKAIIPGLGAGRVSALTLLWQFNACWL